MFQFRRFPSYTYFIQCTISEYCSDVFPHSDISGSTLICSSPKLFAACHVLRRLLMPRHSPCALISLTFIEQSLFYLVLLNYAGSTKEVTEIVFTLNFLKVFPQSFRFLNIIFFLMMSLCCLACFSLHFSLFSFQGAVENTFSCTLKIEQCKSFQKSLT